MKYQFAGVLALAALAANVEARTAGANSLKTVADTKHRLELVYGKGLVGLHNDEGKFEQSRLSWDRRRPAQVWTNIGGIQFDAESFQAAFYGLSYGLQYNKLSAIDSVSESNCFYATYAVLNSVDTLMADFDNVMQFSGSFNWFNIAVYDPVHIISNFSVVYEMCNGYHYFEGLVSLFSKDWGYLAEFVIQDAMYIWLDLGEEIDVLNLALGKPTMDYMPEEIEMEDETTFQVAPPTEGEETAGGPPAGAMM